MVIEFCKVNPNLCPRQLRAIMNSDQPRQLHAVLNLDEITKGSEEDHCKNLHITNKMSPSMKEVLKERIDSVLKDETLFPQVSVKSKIELTQTERDYALDRLHILKILKKLMKNSSRFSDVLEKFQFHHSKTTGDKNFDDFI